MAETPPLLPESVQLRASDPSVSAWVAASAGSGKTKVLTDRILRLLLEGVEPHRILAITFTRAAAAEMANRLNEVLAEWATAAPARLDESLDRLFGGSRPGSAVRERARRLFTTIVDAPTGVRIETIHGFCQSVLRRFPIEAGLSPQFKVLDDRSAREALRLAIDSVLARDSALSPVLRRISVHMAEGRFSELVDEIVAERARFQMLFAEGEPVEAIMGRLAEALGIPHGLSPEGIAEAGCAETAFEKALLREAAEAMRTLGTTKEQEKAQKLIYWLGLDVAARAKGLDSYAGIYLLKDRDAIHDKLLTKKPATAHPHLLEALQREAERLLALLERCRAATLLRHTGDLLHLARAILDAYETRKRLAAEIDFEDLILRTRALLHPASEAAWVHYKLDGGIDHVLLDESQDTNPDQWDLVKSLVAEFFVGEGASGRARTLFAVGDSKQSIFSFQRADPATFDAMRTHFAAGATAADKAWRQVDLDFSFRSTEPILRFVDGVFAPPEVYRGVSEAPPRHVCQRLGEGGLVELWPLARRQEAAIADLWAAPLPAPGIDPAGEVAERIAGEIHRWLRDREILASEDRPIRPGDILVLVRRRTAFAAALVRALKQKGVPVAGVDRMALTKELPVADLMALAQVLLLPEDDMSLAIVLRSPLVGFTDPQLFDVAHARAGTLWQALRESAEPLAMQAAAWLEGWRARTDFIAPYELFAGILQQPCPADPEGSGRRALVARLGSEALDPLDEFLAAVLVHAGQHPPSLEALLGWMREDAEEIKRDATRAGGEGEVAIMTVHGAKGLQAPIVFLADEASVPKPRGKPFVLWDRLCGDGMAYPLWAASKQAHDANCRRLRDHLKTRAEEEHRRLLYVALTRPRDRLYIAGWQAGNREPPDGCWHRLMERATQGMGTLLEDGRWRLFQPQSKLPKTSAAARSLAATVEVPAWLRARPGPEARPVRPLAPSRLVGEEAVLSPLAESGESRRFARGRLIHRLLQTLPDLPEARREDAARRYLAGAARLTGAETDDIVSETLRVISHPAFGIAFGPGSQAEVPVSGLIRMAGGPVALSGQIDRLAVGAGEVMIVDFKTNRPPPEGAESIPPEYIRQMAAYRVAIRPLYPGLSVRALILWTNGPFFTEVPAAAMDVLVA